MKRLRKQRPLKPRVPGLKMAKDKLTLEIITPDGLELKEMDIDEVVLRRQEREIDFGSEVAIFPLHGMMLVKIAISPGRYRKGSLTFHFVVAGGYAEVKENQVTVLTPRFKMMLAPRELETPKKAKELAKKWKKEITDFQKAIVGYLK